MQYRGEFMGGTEAVRIAYVGVRTIRKAALSVAKAVYS
jgi:hypothetical protein